MNTAAMTAPIWDVDARRDFEQAGRRFELRVRFTSDSRRLVLFGPSGAGKSQTLRIIAGLTAPDAGHARLRGEPLVDCAAGLALPARQRGLGYLFQDYALFPHLNVLQNIGFGLAAGWRNPRRDFEHPEVERWLRAFELTAVARHYPEQLSGGQRQRVALARALATGPRALLLDEPFAALDGALRARLRDELAELLTRLEQPLILISHDEADLRALGDEVLQLDNGRVVAQEERA